MTAVVGLGLLLILLLAGIPVAGVLGSLGLSLGALFTSFPVYRAVGEIAWTTSTDFVLVAIPLFVLLGEILLRAGVAERTYDALAKWLNRLPGGLVHANIGTSALFAATSGSSVATAATIGTVALPQARRFGYDEGFFAGSIAAGGTLGILIPPSINMIVYGSMTNTSIPKLFIAGIVPGVLLAAAMMTAAALVSARKPALVGRPVPATWPERWKALGGIVPILLVFLVVVGSIYTGFATPTEAAALGVLAALGLAAWYRTLSLVMLWQVVEATMRTTGMIMFVLLASYFLNFVFATVGLTDLLSDFVAGIHLGPAGTMVVLVLMYVVLGFFIETLSLMVITIPIVFPVVVRLGFDPVWFGVVLIVLIELALITPPVGLNLYVIQGIRGRGSISEVISGAVPFMVAVALFVGVLLIFPQLALTLPNRMG
ncbi:TRAP transporter large permease [Carboxydochorda subterranea]|uniref:TRAP transporter large permease n=1 Tax=Carboxydichorda subterranea TaxID=3109565 RepID=A0ABZ1BVQ5_9FIRM|nr:TRAP transporter large permease [Limnochorda sp. L945t]WRP16222.1 TRAP transporter large permease [Limnochorda sp. L945t]